MLFSHSPFSQYSVSTSLNWKAELRKKQEKKVYVNVLSMPLQQLNLNASKLWPPKHEINSSGDYSGSFQPVFPLAQPTLGLKQNNGWDNNCPKHKIFLLPFQKMSSTTYLSLWVMKKALRCIVARIWCCGCYFKAHTKACYICCFPHSRFHIS